MGTPFDPEKFRRSPAPPTPPRRPRVPLPPRGNAFVKGPIPLDWLSMAARLPGQCCHLGLALWYLAHLNRSATVKVPYTTLNVFGITRGAFYRARDELKNAGLITVDDAGVGKSQFITVLAAPVAESTDGQ